MREAYRFLQHWTGRHPAACAPTLERSQPRLKESFRPIYNAMLLSATGNRSPAIRQEAAARTPPARVPRCSCCNRAPRRDVGASALQLGASALAQACGTRTESYCKWRGPGLVTARACFLRTRGSAGSRTWQPELSAHALTMDLHREGACSTPPPVWRLSDQSSAASGG
jgi:hypothetical protein